MTLKKLAVLLAAVSFVLCVSLVVNADNAIEIDLSNLFDNRVIVESGSCGNNLTWSLDNEGVLIISGNGEMYDFADHKSTPWHGVLWEIKHVIIADGVTSIGDWAFVYCYNLESVKIPKSVISISDYYTFGSCMNLESVVVDEDNEFYSNDDIGALFDKNKKTLIKYPSGNSADSYVIPASVTSIGREAFADCDSLVNVVISEKLTNIGDYAFFDCDKIVDIAIPNGVLSIGEYAFCNCDSIVSIDVPESVCSVGENAFFWCVGLTSIKIPNSVTYIGNDAFAHSVNAVIYCSWDSYAYTYAKEKEIPFVINGSCGEKLGWTLSSEGVLTIEGKGNMENYYSQYSFKEPPWFDFSYSIKSVIIKNGVTSIGAGSFQKGLITSYYPNITSVEIADTVTKIGDQAFYGCSGLLSLNIPDSVKTVGEKAFSYCDNLEYIEIGSGLYYYADNAFSCCLNLKSITVDENNEKLCNDENGALYAMDSKKNKLKLIQYPAANTNSSYVVPDGVWCIFMHAFYNCEYLERINLPDSVTDVAKYAFYGCANDLAVDIPNGTINFDADAFYLCDNVTICGYDGSSAQKYAKENEIDFVLVGDINLDGFVDIMDAILLFQHGMLPELYPIDYMNYADCDYNCDNVIDYDDAVVLFRHSVLPDVYPLYM